MQLSLHQNIACGSSCYDSGTSGPSLRPESRAELAASGTGVASCDDVHTLQVGHDSSGMSHEVQNNSSSAATRNCWLLHHHYCHYQCLSHTVNCMQKQVQASVPRQYASPLR